VLNLGMGRENQPERRKLSPPVHADDPEAARRSMRWEDRAHKGLIGPPMGTPVRRSGGGAGPYQEGNLKGEFPADYWDAGLEAKYRLRQIDSEGRPKKPKHGATPTRPRPKNDPDLLKTSMMNRLLLTKKGDREMGKIWERGIQRGKAEKKAADMRWLQRLREERLANEAEPTS
jgi:hypothetical protein